MMVESHKIPLLLRDNSKVLIGDPIVEEKMKAGNLENATRKVVIEKWIIGIGKEDLR